MLSPFPPLQRFGTGLKEEIEARAASVPPGQPCGPAASSSATRKLRILALSFCVPLAMSLAGCTRAHAPATMVTVLIESSPTNLDLRVGVDAQSEHIGALIFDPLLHKDEHFNLQPWLAESWQRPDPLTYIFHLRPNVRFHNGQPLTAEDVVWTLDSMRNGSIASPRSGNFLSVDRVEAIAPLTVVIHLKHADNALLWNLADGNFGVVPHGSGRDLGQHPIGTGPYKFISQAQDKEVILQRNDDSWQPLPQIPQLRFSVVPDAITRALELQKGSADVEINALTADMVYSLRNAPNLVTEAGPGSILNYINFNVRDPALKDKRVRQAIACAINRPAIIQALFRGHARLAKSLLPIGHWATEDTPDPYPYDPARSKHLLDAAGLKPGSEAIRLRLTMKTSTDETTRLLVAILQQQLREVGIALDIRSYEFGTFYGDITRGAFQMYALRWLGSNEDPDIFRYAFASSSTPPYGANRGYYQNPVLDALLEDAAGTADPSKRREDYLRVQQILADDVPSINLWYLDNVCVHTRRLGNVHLKASGSYDFLNEASLSSN